MPLRMILAMLLVLGAMAAHAAESPAIPLPQSDAAQHVPLNISEVVAGGHWEDAEHEGHYRVVVVELQGLERSVAQVYLQWISAPRQGRPAALVANVPVREFNELRNASASIELDDSVDGEAQIFITTTDQMGGPEHKIRLFASLPGRYALISVPDASTAPRPR